MSCVYTVHPAAWTSHSYILFYQIPQGLRVVEHVVLMLDRSPLGQKERGKGRRIATAALRWLRKSNVHGKTAGGASRYLCCQAVALATRGSLWSRRRIAAKERQHGRLTRLGRAPIPEAEAACSRLSLRIQHM